MKENISLDTGQGKQIGRGKEEVGFCALQQTVLSYGLYQP